MSPMETVQEETATRKIIDREETTENGEVVLTTPTLREQAETMPAKEYVTGDVGKALSDKTLDTVSSVQSASTSKEEEDSKPCKRAKIESSWRLEAVLSDTVTEEVPRVTAVVVEVTDRRQTSVLVK